MNVKWVTPEKIWSNFSELSIEDKVLLTENQYRKQLSVLHSHTPMEREK